MTDKKISIRLAMEGGQTVVSEFDAIGQRGGDAMKRVGAETANASRSIERSSGAMRFQIQNASYQIQDFAVQVASGTSASRAMAQQLPQLLSGFGLFGTIVGTAAAILIPLAANFLGIKDAAKEAETNLGSLEAALSSYIAFTKTATSSTAELEKQFGRFAGEMRADAQWLAQIELGKANAALRQNAAGIAESLQTVIVAQNNAVEAAKNYYAAQDLANKGMGSANMAQSALDAYTILNAQIEEAAKGLGLTATEAINLNSALTNMSGAKSINEIEAASQSALDTIRAMFPAGQAVPPAIQAIVESLSKVHEQAAIGVMTMEKMPSPINAATEALRRMIGIQPGDDWLATAISRMQTLASAAWSAYSAAAAAQGKSISDGAAKGYGGRPEGITDTTAARQAVVIAQQHIAAAARSATGTVSHGSAGAGSKTNTLEQEAKSIYEATRTEAEKYATELERLNQIKAAALIDGETYNRQMDALKEKYGQQGDAISAIHAKLQEFVKSTQDMGSAIGDIFAKSFSSAGDAVAEFVKTGKFNIHDLVVSAIADMAKLVMQKTIIGPLANMLSGALGGSNFITKFLTAGVHHDGGMVGAAGMSRHLPAHIFASVPRFHNGGGFLAANERPAVLKVGERVLNERETVAYNRGGGGIVMNISTPNVQSFRQSRAQIAADIGRFAALGSRTR